MKINIAQNVLILRNIEIVNKKLEDTEKRNERVLIKKKIEHWYLLQLLNAFARKHMGW